MPRFDGKGPLGAGPMTGGGFGFCRPWPGAGRVGGPGYGWSYGRGFGRGLRLRGRGYGPFLWDPAGLIGPEDERALLQAEAADLKAQLAGIEGRLAKLESETTDAPGTK